MKLSAHQIVMVTPNKKKIFAKLREERNREWWKALGKFLAI